MLSVAALSAMILSFLPKYLWQAIAALDVIFINLSINFLSKFTIKYLQ